MLIKKVFIYLIVNRFFILTTKYFAILLSKFHNKNINYDNVMQSWCCIRSKHVYYLKEEYFEFEGTHLTPCMPSTQLSAIH